MKKWSKKKIMTKLLEIIYNDDNGKKQTLKFIMPDTAVEILAIYATEESPIGAMSFYEKYPEREDEDEITVSNDTARDQLTTKQTESPGVFSTKVLT